MSIRNATLRQLILSGAVTFVVAMVAAIAGVLVLTARMRADLERNTAAVLEEQAIADRIISSVYYQLLEAIQYTQTRREANLEAFRRRGEDVYRNIRLYLFRDLSAEDRLLLEDIKEHHLELEVSARHAFDLVDRGEAEAARAKTEETIALALELQGKVDRFVAGRLQKRGEAQARASETLHDLYLSLMALGFALILGILLLTRFLKVRLVDPLAALSSAAARLGAGDLGARVPVHGNDELAAVGRSFNQMAESLQAARDELQARNADLADTLDRLRRTQAELVQNEKLSALGGMLAGLAHELNNPLATVLGYGELLVERLSALDDPRARQLASELARPIATEALRARSLVRNLLQFSRQSAAALDVVDLGEAMRVAVGLRSYAFAQAGLELTVDLESELFVVAESQRLQQVFLNLINNAYDALKEGEGRGLTIRARALGPDEVEVTFRDDGPGFAEPERIFDPFYTTKPVGAGTGLGLTLVHRFVEEFGGSIRASNAAAGGALLEIRLRRAPVPELSPDPIAETGAAGGASGLAAEPVAAHPGSDPSEISLRAAGPRGERAGIRAGVGPAAPAGPAPNAPRAGVVGQRGRRRRVLVVEDEASLRDLQQRLLSRLDVDVLLAAAGAEAQARLGAEAVDLVISDVKMPGEVNGVDLFRWVERERPELAPHFLFVTGDLHTPMIAELHAAHPERFLTKPFQVYEYLERVTQALAGIPPQE